MKKEKSHASRHNEFQFGTNPMKMTEFEKRQVMLERQEREDAHRKFVKGIQGRDGGLFETSYEEFNLE